jgi:hypothetical protein
MESERYISMIQDLKRCVNSMLLERDKLAGVKETASASPIWSEVTSVFSYLMNLSPEDFRNIRFHTGLFSGSSWDYWHRYPEPDPEVEAEKLGYIQAIQGVPEKYWIGEPPTLGIPRPLGVNYRGNIINYNIASFQWCVSSLYHAGALSSAAETKQKQLIVEIGGGYGGLAHSLGNILERQATYLLIDLPEMFLFQGAYLAVNNPEKAIYVYDSETFSPEFLARDIYDYDFALIPNFALDKLHAIQEIAFLINIASFQEMTEEQVREYLDFAKKGTTYCIYSDNLDRHPYNRTGLASVSTLLEEYFDLNPSRQYYDDLYKITDCTGYRCYKRYLGFPKGSGRAPLDSQMLHFPAVPKVSLHLRLLRRLVPQFVRRAVWSWFTR